MSVETLIVWSLVTQPGGWRADERMFDSFVRLGRTAGSGLGLATCARIAEAPEERIARFPLWGRDTGRLAAEMLRSRLRAVVVAVDPVRLSDAACGVADRRRARDRPAQVAICPYLPIA